MLLAFIFVNLIQVELIEVDGYKVRLLSINDIFSYDNNFEKIDGNSYIYPGEGLDEHFLGAWTIDIVYDKCNGNCSKFFIVDYHYDLETDTKEISLNGGHSGLLQIKFVIYAKKSSI